MFFESDFSLNDLFLVEAPERTNMKTLLTRGWPILWINLIKLWYLSFWSLHLRREGCDLTVINHKMVDKKCVFLYMPTENHKSLYLCYISRISEKRKGQLQRTEIRSWQLLNMDGKTFFSDLQHASDINNFNERVRDHFEKLPEKMNFIFK